ncbi:MAG: alpha/beta hydrolase [Paracoccus sp. (in: a-proteobacteria)]|uniref:alpha/beta fold hydrolase n=1 Tax=Paracoccus sp. TaxID=267 RepID=UPI0026DF3DF1|nr:alpha/beta hydrolase [Paracoccus sp. (in: a-proteobacteria)]MDO5631726.1 alpha/beta hydrolase [Paracoccus sp. (in: a-proteobacteria)]
MPFASFKNAEISWKIDGSGPPLVLVHGTGGDADSNWGAIVGQLSRHWTVIRPEYSGSGATKDGGGVLRADDLAGQILAVADAAGAQSFHLMGFSLGAALAAKLAGDAPDRVLSLILLAGFQNTKDPRMQLQFRLWADLAARDRVTLARLILLTGFSPDALAAWTAPMVDEAVAGIVANTDWRGLARQVALDLDIDVSASIPGITAPALVIGCQYDHMVPVSQSRSLAARIAGADYQELPTGHLAPAERPDDLAALIKAFLKRQP